MYPKFDPVWDKELAEYEVEVEDVFNWKGLYQEVFRWLQEEGFKHLDGTDYVEDLYWEKHSASGTVDYHAWWRVVRPDMKNNFFQHFLKINFQGINMGKTEVMVDGHKMKTNQGDGVVRVKAVLMMDPSHKFRDNPILKHLTWWFQNRVYNKEIGKQKGDLTKTAYRLQVRIKQYLGLKHSFEPPKLFHRVKGV